MRLRALLFALSPLLFAAEGWAQDPGRLPAGPDAGLVEQKCAICHELEHIRRSRMSRERWAETIKLMRERGAPLDDAEAAKILDYLARTYGPDRPPEEKK